MFLLCCAEMLIALQWEFMFLKVYGVRHALRNDGDMFWEMRR